MADMTPDPFDLSKDGQPAPVAGVDGDIAPKPKASRGMNKQVLFALLGLGVILFAVFMTTLDKIDESAAQKEVAKQEETKVVLGLTPQEFLADKQGAIARSEVPLPDEMPATADAASGPVVKDKKVPGMTVPAAIPPAPQGLTPEEQMLAKAKMDREMRMAQARAGGLDVRGYQDAGAKDAGAPQNPAAAVAAAAAAMSGASGFGGLGGMSSEGSGEAKGDQEQKLKFIKDGGSAPGGYHADTVRPPLALSQLNAGSYIPSVLEMAVNSDLPGMVTARVRENVYASVRDSCLLIPSASKLVGSYDSRVAIGQNRQLVVWNRVTFPNGYELNLAGMPSADVGGQSGLEADVDNHWFRLFGVALGMSAVTAGVQLSVPTTTSSDNETTTPGQTVSTALAQQFGQLGGQMMGKYLNIQPTLRNYPGERFNIIVPKNIIFPSCYR